MQPSNHLARALLLWALLLGLLAGMVGPRLFSVQAAPVLQAATNVVISEFRTRGPGGASDEFIELYNPTALPVDISGWEIWGGNNAGGTGRRATIPVGTILQSGQHYLVANNPPGNYSGSVTADLAYGTSIADDGGIALINPINPSIPIDQVGMSTGSAYKEGTVLAPMAGATDQSYERLTGGLSDSCVDTNVNSADFTLVSPSAPQNSTSPLSLCGVILPTLTPTSTATVTSTATLTSTLTSTGTPTSTVTPTATGPTPTAIPAAPLSVVINEVAWMGTSSARLNDEWIELYNPGTSAVNLNGWRLTVDDGQDPETDLANFNSSDVIPSKGFFLLARAAGGDCSVANAYNIFSTDTSGSNIVEDKCFTEPLLNNPNGQTLRLYDPPDPTHPNGTTIDVANSDRGNWPAGIASPTYASMERRRIELEGSNTWATFAGPTSAQFARNRDNVLVKGTPKRANWILTVTPTRTPTPAPHPTRIRTATPVPVGRPWITEFLPRPGFDWNQDGQINVFDEFIEIMNVGPVAINMNGWKLDLVSGESFTIPSITLKPGERAVFYGLQTNMLLSDAGDTVRLLNPNGKIWDAQTYSIAKVPDQSWCRLPDATFTWFDDCVPTPGTANTRAGEVPVEPEGNGLQPPICKLPDTLPPDVLIAECNGYGSNMWQALFWDKKGWGDRFVPENTSKWNSFVE